MDFSVVPHADGDAVHFAQVTVTSRLRVQDLTAALQFNEISKMMKVRLKLYEVKASKNSIYRS